MKEMTEETAQDLDKIVRSLQKHAEEAKGVSEQFVQSVKEYYLLLYKSLLISETQKYAKYMLRLLSASVLTRWYWDKKVRRSRDMIIILQEGLNNFNK